MSADQRVELAHITTSPERGIIEPTKTREQLVAAKHSADVCIGQVGNLFIDKKGDIPPGALVRQHHFLLAQEQIKNKTRFPDARVNSDGSYIYYGPDGKPIEGKTSFADTLAALEEIGSIKDAELGDITSVQQQTTTLYADLSSHTEVTVDETSMTYGQWKSALAEGKLAPDKSATFELRCKPETPTPETAATTEMTPEWFEQRWQQICRVKEQLDEAGQAKWQKLNEKLNKKQITRDKFMQELQTAGLLDERPEAAKKQKDACLDVASQFSPELAAKLNEVFAQTGNIDMLIDTVSKVMGKMGSPERQTLKQRFAEMASGKNLLTILLEILLVAGVPAQVASQTMDGLEKQM